MGYTAWKHVQRSDRRIEIPPDVHPSQSPVHLSTSPVALLRFGSFFHQGHLSVDERHCLFCVEYLTA